MGFLFAESTGPQITDAGLRQVDSNSSYKNKSNHDRKLILKMVFSSNGYSDELRRLEIS